MKKLLIYIIPLLFTANAFAQKDVEAKKILAPVSQKYRGYATIKTDFTFTVDNKQANIKVTQNGTLITQPKSNKFKITLFNTGSTTQVDQEIIGDGKTQWTYNKDEKEVQISNTVHGSDAFNPAELFTIYEKGYKYLYTGLEKRGGKLYQMIDLTAENTKTNFFKIRLSIDKVKKQIYSAQIFDKNGSQYTYTLKTFTPNPTLPANTFTYDTKSHPGVEVVDLR